MMPARHHSDFDSTLLPLAKSAITWFGGIFARLTPLAAGLHRILLVFSYRDVCFAETITGSNVHALVYLMAECLIHLPSEEPELAFEGREA